MTDPTTHLNPAFEGQSPPMSKIVPRRRISALPPSTEGFWDP